MPAVGNAQNIPDESQRPVYKEMNLPQADLSKFPKKKGYTVIFDGSSTDGWRAYGRETLPDRWVIEDGALKFDPQKEGSRGDVIFAHKFGNFILEMEWKVSKGANSGILYLIQEVEGQPSVASAPESQVLDNENHPDAKLGKDGNRKSSSLYDLIPAVPQNAKPFGEWNKVKIVIDNGRVEHWQNGKKVVEYELWTPEWNEMLANSKFGPQSWPDAWWLMTNAGGNERKGYIGLQDHGDEVWFRNIRVKVLD